VMVMPKAGAGWQPSRISRAPCMFSGKRLYRRLFQAIAEPSAEVGWGGLG
jgi:hypothetical protein